MIGVVDRILTGLVIVGVVCLFAFMLDWIFWANGVIRKQSKRIVVLEKRLDDMEGD